MSNTSYARARSAPDIPFVIRRLDSPHKGTVMLRVFMERCRFVIIITKRQRSMNTLSITVPLWGESNGDRWIPLTKGQ